MRTDLSSLSFRVGHCHVQLTGIDMYNFTTDEKNEKLVKSKMDYYKSYLNFFIKT